jgi:hypothetical protein
MIAAWVFKGHARTVRADGGSKMKRSLLTMGLLASLGCGGLEPDDGASPAGAASELTAPSEEGATPRVARFAALPATSLVGGSIKPTAWPTQPPTTLDVEQGALKGRFDPVMVRNVEASRLRARLEGGAR